MAGYEVSVDRELLPGLLSGQNGLAKLVEAVLNQIVEEQVTEALGAERHERTEERAGYRNGTRARTLYTRVGPVTLLVPQTRDGSFSTELFKRYQRSEQAFVLALMEMVVQGVSTRKVAAITEELCGVSFSKSTVSALCTGLEVRVRAFNERRLEGEYPFLLVDALFLKSREDDRVVQRAALVVSGVCAEGYREILGVKIGDTESFATWEETFRWLKGRGLSGVAFVVSDEHGGLTQALAKHFQGASWQRCQVHLMRNLLSHASVQVRAEVAAAAKLVFQAPDRAEAKRRLGEFAIGTNPSIDRFTGNTLFDEKIKGTCHMALGKSIPGTGGVNESGLHWDMVCDLRQDSRIYADGELFYENGEFAVRFAELAGDAASDGGPYSMGAMFRRREPQPD